MSHVYMSKYWREGGSLRSFGNYFKGARPSLCLSTECQTYRANSRKQLLGPVKRPHFAEKQIFNKLDVVHLSEHCWYHLRLYKLNSIGLVFLYKHSYSRLILTKCEANTKIYQVELLINQLHPKHNTFWRKSRLWTA